MIKKSKEYGGGGSIAEGNYHMILSQAKEVKHHVDELQDILKKEDTIEAWVVAKMENVSSTLSDVTHYLDGKSEMPKAKRGMKVGQRKLKSNKDLYEKLSKAEENWEKDNGKEYNKILKEIDENRNLYYQLLSDAEINGGKDNLEEYNRLLSMQNEFAEGGETPMAKDGMQTEISAKKWVDTLVEEYGYDQALQRMRYNVSGKNPYFRESNSWVTYAWQRFNEIDPNKYAISRKTPMAKRGMKVDKIQYPSITLKEKDLNEDQTEIFAFIENYEMLNRQMDSIRKNLMTKIARGQFDETKAPKIFMYLIDNGLKTYKKMYGEISLTKKEKEEIANNMVIEFMSEAEQGNYENETFLPKKYLAEDGMLVISYDVFDEDGDAIILMGSEQDLIDFANTMWYYDMLDEDGEEIDDFDVAKDYFEQYGYEIKSNSPKSATKKKKVRRANVK